MTKETGIEIYTRSGRRDLGWYQLEEEALQLPKGYVFDCELIAEGEFENSIELRQATAAIANSHGRRGGCIAKPFDVLPIEEYNEGRSKRSAVGRKAILAGIFGDFDSYKILHLYFSDYDIKHSTNVANSLNAVWHGYPRINTPHIKPVEVLGVVETHKEAIDLATPIWERGFEGVMLVEVKSAYEVNPNPRPTLLKIKCTKEYVLKCVAINEGDKARTGMLGSITLEYVREDKQVYLVNCGSGFSKPQCIDFWAHPEKIVGKWVEVESFGESKNNSGGYSLNVPIFKRIKGARE